MATDQTFAFHCIACPFICVIQIVNYPTITLLLQVLDNQGRSATATVADASNTNLGLPLLQHGGESGDNTSTRAAKRVTNSNRATVNVDSVGVETKDLDISEGNSREGLVDLSGSNGESLGLTLSITPTKNLGKRLEVKLLELGLGDKNNSGSTVVDGGSVGSSDTAVRLKSRTHGLELLNVQVLDLVVTVDLGGRLATSARDLNGDDLGEKTGLGGSLGLLVGVDGVLVLFLAGELVVLDTELSSDTHVVLLERVGQAILKNAVDKCLVAVLGTVSEIGEVVRSVGHRLGSTSNNDIRGAEHNVLGTKNNGLEG
ncbi:hypothetical protein HG530_009557 [Fusarium avenaceum]|nr:hypothetical protein HG530_009557 [Fusarium avenaceum]